MRQGRWLAAALAAVLLTAGCGVSQGGASNSAGEANRSADAGTNAATASAPSAIAVPGHPAPAFTLTNLQTGQSVSLSQLLGSKPIILNVWASWCQPCNAETPDLVHAAQQYGQQVQFVGVNLTSLDSADKAKAFVAKYHVPYTVLSDAKGTFYDTYGITAVPTTYVISPKGIVVAVHTGQIVSQQAVTAIVKEAMSAT
ncbi:TlpA family protein disulfide reductase [Alicyclobacillus cycloheptanicus]|uniref:Peroxiredoxin n=1 Tax=Alicyclobacillus cycloheptanicus TaxID=1457 RepID=A0ABT9XL26_9BACL|nr:TlpA disulfide reductase family protein [Alicyclobacillus cycloheptanicus]MDQ0191007.1 peroxiredoxin [Alicyclobacillus cycloheptanicus]WDM00900.1 TlpA family protein disulfide reductase [Alicyclobacillus cycloheptanicus]